jgi:lipoprotein-anchoring transpeptidase ErfK/SrfK
MWRKRALAATFLAVVSCSSAFADSAKSRVQPATSATSSTAIAAAAISETASGTTTYFGSESQPARAAAKPEPAPPPTLTASIDLANQTMTVSINGGARYSWPISSGTAQYPTPTGSFYPEWTAKIWYSRKYDWAPMPHAVFINGGVAVHGTNAVGGLGRPASHGCIRLSPANAKTFYNLVERHGLNRTRVTVFGRPHWRGDAIASRSTPRAKTVTASQEWLFGNPWGVTEDTAFSPGFTKKPRGAYAGVNADGVPTKVRRRQNGEAVAKLPAQRRKYSSGSGYAD